MDFAPPAWWEEAERAFDSKVDCERKYWMAECGFRIVKQMALKSAFRIPHSKMFLIHRSPRVIVSGHQSAY